MHADSEGDDEALPHTVGEALTEKQPLLVADAEKDTEPEKQPELVALRVGEGDEDGHGVGDPDALGQLEAERVGGRAVEDTLGQREVDPLAEALGVAQGDTLELTLREGVCDTLLEAVFVLQIDTVAQPVGDDVVVSVPHCVALGEGHGETEYVADVVVDEEKEAVEQDDWLPLVECDADGEPVPQCEGLPLTLREAVWEPQEVALDETETDVVGEPDNEVEWVSVLLTEGHVVCEALTVRVTESLGVEEREPLVVTVAHTDAVEEGEALLQGEADSEGLALREPHGEGETEADTHAEGDCVWEALTLELRLVDAVYVGEGLADGVAQYEEEALVEGVELPEKESVLVPELVYDAEPHCDREGVRLEEKHVDLVRVTLTVALSERLTVGEPLLLGDALFEGLVVIVGHWEAVVEPHCDREGVRLEEKHVDLVRVTLTVALLEKLAVGELLLLGETDSHRDSEGVKVAETHAEPLYVPLAV